MKIVTIEDTRSVRKIIAQIITALGHEALEAADGEAGLAVVWDHPDVSLVLLDREMPRMDGIEFLRKFKQLEDRPEVPVIMISAAAERSSVIEALEAGAIDFLPKPFTPEALATKIARYCSCA